MGKRIETVSSETMNALVRHPWPGNIRELQNVIERAVILSQGPILKVPLTDLKARGAELNHINGNEASTLEEVERRHILSILEQTNWVFAGPNGASARLGIKRPTSNSACRSSGFGVRREPEIRGGVGLAGLDSSTG
jgi:formate hydrogenlyase transcriptional activator